MLAPDDLVQFEGILAIVVVKPGRQPMAQGVVVQSGQDKERQLRYGRGLDNRKLKHAGFRYRYTSREAVLSHAEALRVRRLTGGTGEPYRYEREVEEFLRLSPSVRRRGTV
jgi:hypothetical protein